jgi:hypothetical protein
MSKITVLLCTTVILLAFCAAACAETPLTSGSGAMTNVYFCKMTKVNETYELEPLPTLFTGQNDYGRYTFVSISQNLSAGDYAIVQETADGLKLVQSLSIEPTGSPAPEYTMLTLDLAKDELPATLVIKDTAANTAVPATTQAPASASTVSGSAPASGTTVAPAGTAAQPAATQSPASPLAVLAGLGISGVLYLSFRRR